MALVNLGNDPWLSEYEACDKLQREIMEQLSSRSKETRSSQQYVSLSAAIRLRLKQYKSELTQLKKKLDDESKTRTITYEETERRTRQIELLHSKNVQMQKLFDNQNLSYNYDRSRLLGTNIVQDLGTANWGTDDDDDDGLISATNSSNTVDDIKEQQQKLLKDQENGLDELSKIISRQKNIAHTISTEVDLHNEIIDDLGDHIDRTDTRVINETQHIQIVERKDRTCGYWIVIILLFISIIIVAIV